MKKVKSQKPVLPRAAPPPRRAAAKATKFEFSSDSSEFENSEDDFMHSD